MKTKILLVSLFVLGMFIFNPVQAEEEERDVPTFSEISLKIEVCSGVFQHGAPS